VLLQGVCDGADEAPATSTELLPNQCVLKMSGQTRHFLATDGENHNIFIQNLIILRQHDSGDPRAALSLFSGQIALYDVSIESNRYQGAPAIVMDSTNAFVTRACTVLALQLLS
jgi:hypothetical protein